MGLRFVICGLPVICVLRSKKHVPRYISLILTSIYVVLCVCVLSQKCSSIFFILGDLKLYTDTIISAKKYPNKIAVSHFQDQKHDSCIAHLLTKILHHALTNQNLLLESPINFH